MDSTEHKKLIKLAIILLRLWTHIRHVYAWQEEKCEWDIQVWKVYFFCRTCEVSYSYLKYKVVSRVNEFLLSRTLLIFWENNNWEISLTNFEKYDTINVWFNVKFKLWFIAIKNKFSIQESKLMKSELFNTNFRFTH